MASRLFSRLRHTLLAALVAGSVAVPVSGMARPASVPAPAPTQVTPLRGATVAALTERYDVARDDIRAAERTAAADNDLGRAAALRAMEDPARHFLTFDGRDGGRAAEVVGDLATADHVAVLVPGADTSLDTYERFRAGAVALQHQLGARAAVVAWLGYETPGTASVKILTSGRAVDAAPGLRRFVTEIAAARPSATVSLLCHSYGTVVCARAVSGLRVGNVADVVLFGSPGTGYDDMASLHTSAQVWAGRGASDWIADVPHVQLFGTVGFGADPVSRGFGAQIFPAGQGGHGDYLTPGSTSLRNLAQIVAGQTLAAAPDTTGGPRA